MGTRWRKILSDLFSSKIRTLLVIFSISIGVFSVGFVATSFPILLEDMDANFQKVNPHGAVLYCEPFDESLLNAIKNVPGVGDAEGRNSVTGRVEVATGEKAPVEVLAIPSLEKMQIDKLSLEKGTPDLKNQEVYVERSSLSVLPVDIGDSVNIELSDGRIRAVKVAGIVHDAANIPYVFAGQIILYANQDTIMWMGGSDQYYQLYLTVSENKTDEAYVNAVAKEVADKIEKGGRRVYFTLVFQPGRHYATDITQGLGAMMGIFGALSVFLGGFLVVNTITALLGQHIRQIGMMKAIGGKRGQLITMYLILVMFFGVIAFLIAFPLSTLFAFLTAQTMASYINFNLQGFRVPLFSVILQLVLALGVPTVAAMVPVLQGTRLTVREAISNYGLGKGSFGKNWFDRLLENVRNLPRPLLISLRNTFRRKARLFLTLSTLTLAGAIFISIFNVRASMHSAIDLAFGYFLSDVNADFNRSYRMQRLEPLVMGIPGVKSVEGWGSSGGQIIDKDGSVDEIVFIAPPSDSTLIKASMTAGRWLVPEDQNAMVVGNHLLKLRPDLRVGDEVIVKINKKDYTWKIVGFYQMPGTVIPPLIYANYEYLSRLRNEVEQVYSIRIVTSNHDVSTQQKVAQILETKLEEAGIQVSDISTSKEIIDQQNAFIDVLVYFLVVMAVLIALVGGLGLMGTMSMNVLERTREIGVMRSIGAKDRAILQLVIVEGMFIGIISWILGAILSIPISLVLTNVVGEALLESPIDFVFSWDGFIIWLISVLVVSALASAIPARNASRLTVREVLAYE